MNFKNKKPQWITKEILDLMEQRKQHKHNIAEYRKVHEVIKQKICATEESWMASRCRELKELENKHYSMYKKVRRVSGLYNKLISSTLVDNISRSIINEREILKAWNMYLANLFEDNRVHESDDMYIDEVP